MGFVEVAAIEKCDTPFNGKKECRRYKLGTIVGITENSTSLGVLEHAKQEKWKIPSLVLLRGNVQV
jgi:hypothetical protein